MESMRKLPVSRRALLAVLAAAPFVYQAPVEAAGLTALDQVKVLLSAQQDAWNRGDIVGFCAPYAEDCIFLTPTGVTRGRLTVQERFRKKYGQAPETMGRLSFEVLDTRVTADTVTMAMKWSLAWQGIATIKPPASGSTLIVWQRLAVGWRLVQDASM